MCMKDTFQGAATQKAKVRASVLTAKKKAPKSDETKEPKANGVAEKKSSRKSEERTDKPASGASKVCHTLPHSDIYHSSPNIHTVNASRI